MPASNVERIVNYLNISDTLATAGQPVRQQFRDIKAAGYDLVINLAMPDSPNALPDEAELVAAHGMEYIHIQSCGRNQRRMTWNAFSRLWLPTRTEGPLSTAP